MVKSCAILSLLSEDVESSGLHVSVLTLVNVTKHVNTDAAAVQVYCSLSVLTYLLSICMTYWLLISVICVDLLGGVG